MEKEDDDKATAPLGSPLRDQSLPHGSFSAPPEVVEAARDGANAAGNIEEQPESSEYFLPPHHPSKTGAFKLKIGQVEETGLDTLLRKMGSIIRKVEKMMKLIQSGQVVKVEDHLKYPDVKFLGELYGDLSLVLDDLSEKTAATLPVLHACLQEEEEELFRRIPKSEEVRRRLYEFLTSLSKAMEKEDDDKATAPLGSPLRDQSLPHGSFSAPPEVVEAARDGANAAGNIVEHPESSEVKLDSKHCHGSTSRAGVEKPTFQDSLAFMRNLKDSGDESKYKEFLLIMLDFSTRKQHPAECVLRAKDLLKDHPELSLGFNIFLPDEYNAAKEEPTIYDALALIARVKHRFRGHKRKFRIFLAILNTYWRYHFSSDEIWEQMKLVLEGHQDLLDGFRYFLPDDHPSTSRVFRFKIRGAKDAELQAPVEEVLSLICKVEKLLKMMEADQVVRIEDHLTLSDLRYIEELYDDDGLEFLENLRENTATVLPVLFARLNQNVKKLLKEYEEVRDMFHAFIDRSNDPKEKYPKT